MFCPLCQSEYREGFTQCNDCDVALVIAKPEPAAGAADLPSNDEDAPVLLWRGGNPVEYTALVAALRDAGISFYENFPRDFENTISSRSADRLYYGIPNFDLRVHRRDLVAGQRVLESVQKLQSQEAEPDAIAADALTSGLPLSVDARLKGVRGWLLFFVLLLTCLNPLITLRALVTDYAELESSGRIFQARFFIFFLIHTIFYFGARSFGVYAGIALWKIWPGAVRLAKRFLLTFVVWGCADWFLTFSFQGGQADFVKDLRFLFLWCGLWWYLYLARSKRVAATYPH